MNTEQKNISFTKLTDLTYSNISMLPGKPSLYMICMKDKHNNNQVIFAGVTSNLKIELTKHLEKHLALKGLTFCYTPMSAKNASKNSKKPLYERVA